MQQHALCFMRILGHVRWCQQGQSSGRSEMIKELLDKKFLLLVETSLAGILPVICCAMLCLVRQSKCFAVDGLEAIADTALFLFHP